MTKAEKTRLHKSYMEHSDYYRVLFEKHGEKIPKLNAQFVANNHYVTLSHLDVQPNEFDMYDLLDLIMELGY